MKILADLHVHTLASGHAYSTIEETAKAAAAKGLEMIAITDHGPAMPGGPHQYYFGNMRVLPPEIHGVEILRGAEVNILDEQGSLDLKEYYLKRLDIVLAGLHNVCMEPLCQKKNTKALVNALQNPYVDIIVHPGNPDFPIEMEKVVQTAKQQNKALEINNSSFLVRKGSRKPCREIARLAREYGILVSISSDSHFSGNVGELDLAVEVALDAGIPAENILNINGDRVRRFLARRGKRRFVSQSDGK
ncbi:phosphatase [Dethiobacter alkaliphilus]|uniref:PHP domain protein n=1 Tax=Dethiobacter alkaliphilus AHT 1 TaxID=555088 RepID=C0GFA5_DETAL|nr:phosphatase [Dethiobacter alkaliphilus]EEG77865.1 PHP domain protein [Dethiobacter alkaliphilus AHT 1]